MRISQALNPRRIARSLVTVLALTLIQTVVPTIVIPQIVTPKAEAVDVSFASFPGGTDVLVPSGATSVTITVRGAAGGTGGADGTTSGLGSSAVGYITATFSVVAGDRLLLYPGGAGGNGLSGGSAAGGTAGPKSNPMNVSGTTSSFKVSGTWGSSYNFNGGTGGATGSYGSSGSGGGGGAASFVALNENILAVAGGGGGGGGAGNGASNLPIANPSYTPNGTNVFGANGATPTNCGANLDGGGGGGGGGGWYGGTGGAATVPSGGSECSGTGGSRGGNHVASNALTSTNTTTAANGAGFITYEFTVASTSACVTDVQTNDIYTIVRVNSTTRCTWSVPSTVSIVDLFLVGGGAGGAGDSGGGGGGGAILSRTAVAISPSTTLTLKAGYGGAASNWAFPSDAFAGDSTTVTTSSNITYSALGGARSVNGNLPGGAGGLGGVASNGGFSGGAGGAGGTCFNVGSIGKTGATNYYYASVIEYGGGGGGGSCPNGAATTAAAGVSGGGSGGFASSATVNQPGTNGLDGRGGGGGGGVATGSGMKLPGGKGGSGVILIRYATNAADAFPASLTSALAGRYSPGDLQLLDSTRKGWIDSSGTNATVSNANITSTGLSILNQGVTDGGVTTGSTKSLLAVRGTVNSKITFQNLNTGYTLFNVARYVASGTNRRIFTARDVNWLSGFYYGVRETHHNAWLTDDARVINTQWLLSTDQAVAYRANGIDVADNDDSIGTQLTSAANFGINNWVSGDTSDFQVSDVLIFNRELTMGEIRLMETYLSRINGLTLSPYFNTSETDTTYSGTATYSYFFGQQDSRNNLNDTFTVEAWLRPDAACNTTVCTYFAREGSIRLVVRNGLYEFLLFGDGNWEWVPTGVAVKSGEWQHVAISKTLRGNRGDSVKLYINGQLAYTKAGSPYRVATTASSNSDASTLAQVNTWSYIGVVSGGGERWRGEIDEFKIWKVARTQAEILSDMHSNDGSSPLMQAYYDMNFVSGARNNEFKIPNLAYGGHGRSDLFNWTVDTLTFNDVKTVATSGPYTTITFPRTYITQTGGWKVPESVTAASTIVVGGGGGAGKTDSKNEYPAGAGGGGGVTYVPVQAFNPSSFIPVTVGAGGRGATVKANDASDRNGQSSYLGVGAGLTALGGGGGGSNNNPGAGGSTVATGGGGGGSRTAGSCAALGSSGGTVPSGYNGAQGGWGWGGLGGSARGAATTSGCYGIPGDGFIDPVTNVEYGHTGSNQFHSTWSGEANYTIPNNGWGGSVSYGFTAIASGEGISGSAGAVIIRYITASRPTYTKPTNAFLNVGMTETFTTNVAQDSATAMLTRTFRWESTTAGSGGPFTTIKQGTGANNAFFSWVPNDTSTTGSNFLYRLTVTDSDTAGLFITDSSTAFAVINGALSMTGINTIKKTINVARSDTYTVFAGTSTYRYSLSPIIPGITLDSATAMSPVLRISDTATVGTYLETITVTDSVSATFSIPLTITISAPPSLTAGGEIVKNGQVLNLDASNRWGVLGVDGVATNSLPWNDLSGNKKNAITSNATSTDTVGTLCKAPTFSNDFGGHFTFNGTDTCYYTPYLGSQFTSAYTIEAWIRPSSGSIPGGIQILSQMYNTVGEQISLTIGALDQNNGKIYVGFYSGNGWRFANFPITPIASTWMHITGTYDGTTLRTYLNGALLGSATYSLYGTLNTKGYFIGKRWDSTYFYTGSIAEVRAYNVSLSDSQVALNYNATKYRYETGNQTILKPTQKYGALNIETFTVTSGGDTKTVTFATGNRTGITWDTTSTPGQIKLSVQESLTPGTYSDTITVTDNFGSATTLPIRFTVTKADTLTVFIDTPTALDYTGSRALFSPVMRTIGAVGLESGTVLSPVLNYKPAGTSCATGGYCRVGDIGPGGGIVFIDTSTTSSDGRIYEVAPQNWSGSDDLSTVGTYCSNNNSSIGASQFGIGWGDTNTSLARTACLGGAVGRVNSFNLSNTTGFSDWFIPSKNEGIELAKVASLAGLLDIGSNWTVGNWGYWGSTEESSSEMATIGHVGPIFNGTSKVLKSESAKNMVRPVRAFRACWAVNACNLLATTDTPTAAGTYVITPSALPNISTLQDRYSNVVYSESRMTINRIAQQSQVIPVFNLTFPDTFTLNVTGGDGNGAVRFTVTNGEATGCGSDYKKIFSTTAGSCNITVVKSGDRNYLTDTTTASVYFLLFVFNQPAPAVGSGPNIALSGENDVTVDIDLAPVITSLSTYAATAGVTALDINGVGFNGSDPQFELKFARVAATGFTINAEKTRISITVPAGTRTGKVTVTTSKGLAVSEFQLVITP